MSSSARHKFYGLLLTAALFGITQPAQAINIESGKWMGMAMSSNAPSEIFFFQAYSNETVIVRVANEDAKRTEIPNIFISYEDRSTNPYTYQPVTTYLNGHTICNLNLAITNNGWFRIICSIPPALAATYEEDVQYSISMLRLPNAPLSYQDLDVGIIQSGQYKWGTIHCGADLDAAMFAVSNRCTVQIRMGQDNVSLVPQILLYDPQGTLVTNAYPPEYRAEITATLTNQGIYTVVLSDYFHGAGRYAVSMIKIPGSLHPSDTDIGVIISGETKTGTVNAPGDLDAAFINAVSNDIINIVMQEVDSEVNPVIELFDPSGNLLQTGQDIFQERAIITRQVKTSGVFTVICKDAEDRKINTSYTLSMNFLPGSPSLQSLPDAPKGLSATDGVYSNRVEVRWNAAAGANSYDLWRSHDTNAALLVSAGMTATIYQDYNVTPDVTYYYKVKSRNDYGTSTNFSNTDSGYCGTAVKATTRRALLVGIDNYSPSYGPTPLNTCVNDLQGMRDIFMLGDPSNRWASSNMVELSDRQATKDTIRNNLNTLAEKSAAGDMIVYFHSSHGGHTSGGSPTDTYICAYDKNFTDAELADDLARFLPETQVIVIIDACYSGGMFKDGRARQPWLFAENVMAHYQRIQTARFKSAGKTVPKNLGANIAFMTASDYDELSWTSDFYSLYAGFLIEGCQITTTDTNQNGEYNFLELHDYAARQTVAARPTQHAQHLNQNLLQNAIARGVGSNIVTVAHLLYNDYDGDRASDLAVFNPATGLWRIASLKRWLILAWDNFIWGAPGFVPVDGDYDGDRASDLAIYHEQTGEWRIASLKRYAIIAPSFRMGNPGAKPVSGDYNGDRIADIALYQQPNGYWYITTSTGIPLVQGESFTGQGFLPVSGDYDGDRVADLAMFHPQTGYWYIGSLHRLALIAWGFPWGIAGGIPVSGDYDGDGYSDLAIYQPQTGYWHIWSLKRSAVILNSAQFGGAGFIPVPGDYNGDGRDDLAVYQESTGYWFFRTVDGQQSFSLLFPVGGPGFIPVRTTIP